MRDINIKEVKEALLKDGFTVLNPEDNYNLSNHPGFPDELVIKAIDNIKKYEETPNFKLANMMFKNCKANCFGDIFGMRDGQCHLIQGTNTYKFATIDRTDGKPMFCKKAVISGLNTFLVFCGDSFYGDDIIWLNPSDRRYYRLPLYMVSELGNLTLADGLYGTVLIGANCKELIPAIYSDLYKSHTDSIGNQYIKCYGGKAYYNPVMVKINALGTYTEYIYEELSGIDNISFIGTEMYEEHFKVIKNNVEKTISKQKMKFKLKVNGIVLPMKEYNSIGLAYREPNPSFYVTLDNGDESKVGLIDSKGNEIVSPGNYTEIIRVNEKSSILKNNNNIGLYSNGKEIIKPGDILEYGITQAFKVTYIKHKNGRYYFIGSDGKLYKNELDPFEYYVLQSENKAYITAKTYYKWITVDNNLKLVDIGDEPSRLVVNGQGCLSHILCELESSCVNFE